MVDYFYTSPDHISDTELEVIGDEFNHLIHVMRKGIGDTIRVVDGRGTAYDVTLTRIRKRIALGTIQARYPHHNEPDMIVHLAVGLLKNPSKFDFLVEKATELGVQRIIPLLTERTIPRHARVERWQKLALAAMKQCARSVLPTVEQTHTVSDILELIPSYDRAMICHGSQEGTRSLMEQFRSLPQKNSILILIGPEGGFSDQEVNACVEAGCSVASLGPRRLRTETAAIVATAFAFSARQ